MFIYQMTILCISNRNTEYYPVFKTLNHQHQYTTLKDSALANINVSTTVILYYSDSESDNGSFWNKSWEAISGSAPEGAGGAAAPAPWTPRGPHGPSTDALCTDELHTYKLCTCGRDWRGERCASVCTRVWHDQLLPSKATFNTAVCAASRAMLCWVRCERTAQR